MDRNKETESESVDVDDLASLSHLDENVLLSQLDSRYKQNKIYTYVGDIVVAINPFTDLPIYGKDVSKQYCNAKKSAQPPHIYAVADTTYQAMIGRGRIEATNQCIVISGESGAGKTESTKFIIKQLMDLCRSNTQLEQQILMVNPLLEAFGNAQTLMNDNSSRFGKYIMLKFGEGKVLGAKISEYLLEKSRVVRQSKGENNFHIFYWMLAGKTTEELNKLHLKKTDFRYLSNGLQTDNTRVTRFKNEFADLQNSMDLVGFTDDEKESLFTALAGVLHLGNVKFGRPSQSSGGDDDELTILTKDDALLPACSLLGLEVEEVASCLTSIVTVTKGEFVQRNYTQQQAEDARDAMAKAIYGRFFGWIVNRINCLVAPQETSSSADITEIGILDIFGFEHFEHNSFEQACINLANEQLQFFFNQFVFKQEQEEYSKEGIDWSEIPYADNQPLLDLFILKPIGILSLLDEQCQFPQASDLTFVEKLNTHFEKSPYYVKYPPIKPEFAINHYAGKVKYSGDKWLEKNRDTFPAGVIESLQASKNLLLRSIFKASITRTGSLAFQGRTTVRSKHMSPMYLRTQVGKRKMTVGSQFRSSLHVLMEKMNAASPVFVRCLKPNQKKMAKNFDREYILAQLLYTGMLQTTQIRREGFAVRPTFQEFVSRYQILMCRFNMAANQASCQKILQDTKIQGWHVGKTKVFLKYWHVDQLVDLVDRMSNAAVQVQRLIRGFISRRYVRRVKEEARRRAEELEKLALLVEQMNQEKMKQQEQLNEADKEITRGKLEQAKVTVVPMSEMAPYADYQDPDTVATFLKPSEQFTNRVSSSQQTEPDVVPDEVLEDDYSAGLSQNDSKYGLKGTKQATTLWFKDTQTDVVLTETGEFAEWFHGVISRRESERLLKSTKVGHFLIRVSESRFGYSLSFRAADRCRHYMIDQLPNDKYIIIGEPKVHRSLTKLIEYHQKTKISNWNGLLTDACGQEDGQCDYQDLIEASHKYYTVENAENARAPVTKPALPSKQPSLHHYIEPIADEQDAFMFQSSAASGHSRPPIPSRLPPRPARNVGASENQQPGRPLPQIPENAYKSLLESQQQQHGKPPTRKKRH